MNKKYITLIMFSITTFNLIHSMESLPEILTPHCPTSQKATDLWKIYITDDSTMYRRIEPKGIISNNSQQNIRVLDFKDESPQSCTMLLSNNDQCFGIQTNDSYIEDPIKITRKQIQKLAEVAARYSIVLWDGKNRYDIQRIQNQPSLLEQINTINTTLITLASAVLTQHYIIENTQNLTELSHESPQVALDVTEEVETIEKLTLNINQLLGHNKELTDILLSNIAKADTLTKENLQLKTRQKYFLGIGTIALLAGLIARYLLSQ